MPWEKVNRLFTHKYFLIALLIFLFSLTRFPSLGNDAINPDAVNWHFRSEQFVVGLKNQLWERTYQHYHPGVTLMWIMGPTVEIARQINPEYRVYDHTNFLYLHTLSKYVLVGVQLILTMGVLYVFSKILGFDRGYLVTLLFTLEPFFIGNSRMLHMDVLLTLFLALGLGFAYLGLFSENKEGGLSKPLNMALSGMFLGCSFLTKSIAIGAPLFVLGMILLVFYKEPRKLLKYGAYFLVPFFVNILLFFPAMWVSPIGTIIRIFDEAERVGIRKGHGQIFFGEYTLDPGLLFYPIVGFLKTSPVILAGFIAFFVGLFDYVKNKKIPKAKELSFLGFLTIFFTGYLVVMTASSKKLDRYLIPMFPYFSLIAVWGFEKVLKSVKFLYVGFLLVFLLGLNFLYHPYQFTYTTPVLGSTKNAHEIVAQKPFGIGIPALKEAIFERYGDYPSLGFYDVKPMRTIYKSSQISDVRVYGTDRYDLLVIGPDEEIPQKVLESDHEFNLDYIMRINGLDYWRIYVKETSENQ